MASLASAAATSALVPSERYPSSVSSTISRSGVVEAAQGVQFPDLGTGVALGATDRDDDIDGPESRSQVNARRWLARRVSVGK